MAKIIINRKSEWMNRLRGIRILVDGKYVRSIKNGGAEEFEVTPGLHTIKCEIDWCASKTLEISVNENDVVFLQLRSGMKYLIPVYIVFLAVLALRFIFRLGNRELPEWVDNVQVALLIPLALYFVFYLTVGRKKYLVLEKDTSSIFNN